MKTIEQILRQPIKTLSGLLLMTIAASILCVCVGQAIAAYTTKEALNQRFSTVAIPVIQENSKGVASADGVRIENELLTWLETMAAEHPDIIKTVARHGLLSAYIPQMTPYNVTTDKYLAENITSWDHYEYYQFQSDPYAMPYSCAMLVITLDEVSQPTSKTVLYGVNEDVNSEDFTDQTEYEQWLNGDPKPETITATNYYQLEISGTVTDVVSLADGYRNPVGRIARLTYTASTLEEINTLNLVPGQQYIVYGMDYFDEHWAFIGEINYNGKLDHVDFEPFDPDLLDVWPEQKQEAYREHFGKEVYGTYNFVYISKEQFRRLNSISMHLNLPVSQVNYEEIRDENGKLVELKPITTFTRVNGNGEMQSFSSDEFNTMYQIPTIAKLESSVEDFLNSVEGSAWQAALERDAINNHAFAVVGVDKLSYLAVFSLEKALIVDGREFTQEELDRGARVCLLHEIVAEANGLSVGDTITLNLYGSDYSLPYQSFQENGKGLLNPTASFYFHTTPIAETAEYTIVGFWRGETPWPNVAENAYAFSANTVFAPKSSVQTPMEEANSVPLVTPILQNGKINEFHDLTLDSGYGGRFKYNDQGYSNIAGNFHNYEKLAKQVMLVGAVIYVILLLLYLLLYPGSQKNAVHTMASLGVKGGKRFVYVLASAMAIVIPASILGGVVGYLLWESVVTAMQAAAESTVSMRLQPGTLALVAGAQLLVAIVMNTCVAIFVSAHKGMSVKY